MSRAFKQRLFISIFIWLMMLSTIRIMINYELTQLDSTDYKPSAPIHRKIKFKKTIQPKKTVDKKPVTSIPQIIHFTARSEHLRRSYTTYLRAWYLAYPTFTFYLWRDQDAECLIRQYYPDMLAAYNTVLQTPLEKSDFIRILVMHQFGGLYIDLDTEPVSDMTHLFDNPLAGAMLATEPAEHAVFLYNQPKILSNAILFGVPNHKFYMYFMRYMLNHLESIEKTREPKWLVKRTNYHAVYVTGPLILHNAYHHYQRTYPCDDAESESKLECTTHTFEPVVFGPYFDEQQIPMIRKMCQNISSKSKQLSKLQKEGCQKISLKKYKNEKLTSATLAIHHFKHWSSHKSVITRLTNYTVTRQSVYQNIPTIKLYKKDASHICYSTP